MAEDKIKVKKNTEDVNNIYALDLDFEENIEEVKTPYSMIDDDDEPQVFQPKKKRLSIIEEGIRTSKKRGRPRKTDKVAKNTVKESVPKKTAIKMHRKIC